MISTGPHPEKKLARHAFDTALEAALAKTMAEFKRKANAATQPSDMWEVEDYLREQRRGIDRMLAGLSQDKWDAIRRDLAVAAGHSASG